MICSLTASKEMLRKKQAGFYLLDARMLVDLLLAAARKPVSDA